jgi:hypothetical protein
MTSGTVPVRSKAASGLSLARRTLEGVRSPPDGSLQQAAPGTWFDIMTRAGIVESWREVPRDCDHPLET